MAIVGELLMKNTFLLLLWCVGTSGLFGADAISVTHPTGADTLARLAVPGVKTNASDGWLMAYFRQRYDSRVEIDAAGKIHNVPLPNPMRAEQLHLALSSDGRHWTPLNQNQPVWQQWLRDPFLAKDRAGLWHLLATGGGRRPGETNRGPTCLYAVSRDLVHWEPAQSLTLMADVRDQAGRPARNIWAPEWFYDRKSGDYILLWSSSFEDAGWKRSQIWWTQTRDWKTFAPAQVLFAPPYSAIDGTLLEHNGTYYLFHKEEEFGAATGERRAIRVATAKQVQGPYELVNGPLNQGQIVPTITEGPSVIPDPSGTGWLLLYDYCMSDAYGASRSPDLRQWTVEKDVAFPPDARHGAFVRLTAQEARRLQEQFGGEK